MRHDQTQHFQESCLERHACRAAAFSFTLPVFAQYPARPLTPFVPWRVGGGMGVTARMIAGLLHEGFGQPVHVVNRTEALAL